MLRKVTFFCLLRYCNVWDSLKRLSRCILLPTDIGLYQEIWLANDDDDIFRVILCFVCMPFCCVNVIYWKLEFALCIHLFIFIFKL